MKLRRRKPTQPESHSKPHVIAYVGTIVLEMSAIFASLAYFTSTLAKPSQLPGATHGKAPSTVWWDLAYLHREKAWVVALVGLVVAGGFEITRRVLAKRWKHKIGRFI